MRGKPEKSFEIGEVKKSMEKKWKMAIISREAEIISEQVRSDKICIWIIKVIN